MNFKKLIILSIGIVICTEFILPVDGGACFNRYKAYKKQPCRKVGLHYKQLNYTTCCEIFSSAAYAEHKNGIGCRSCVPNHVPHKNTRLIIQEMSKFVEELRKESNRTETEWITTEHNEKTVSIANKIPRQSKEDWGEWMDWGVCSSSCGTGWETRYRQCLRTPSPLCTGDTKQLRPCFLPNPCPVDGGWSVWGEFSECTPSCGATTKTRIRLCNSPSPLEGGKECPGPSSETMHCPIRTPCPIDGGWSHWSSWSSCPVSCGESLVHRSRTCTSPSPRYGGKPCSHGNQTQMESTKCWHADSCRGSWTEWWDWGPCNTTCGKLSYQSRRRVCVTGGNQSENNCVGDNKEERDCTQFGLPSCNYDITEIDGNVITSETLKKVTNNIVNSNAEMIDGEFNDDDINSEEDVGSGWGVDEYDDDIE